MISVREAKAIPRPDDMEWRNKYICVEGRLPLTTV
jgi:poly(A) RNA polymerase GLD2